MRRLAKRRDVPEIKNEKDLQPYEHIFADADYWKRIGEEYQNPLIVTGTVLFTPHSQAGMVQREREVIDPLGRRRVEPVREYMERKGFILDVQFIFIDGRSGAQMPGEKFREERLYNQNDNTPALSSVFRADGRNGAALPEHAEHAEGQGIPRTDQIGSGFLFQVPRSGSGFP